MHFVVQQTETKKILVILMQRHILQKKKTMIQRVNYKSQNFVVSLFILKSSEFFFITQRTKFKSVNEDFT